MKKKGYQKKESKGLISNYASVWMMGIGFLFLTLLAFKTTGIRLNALYFLAVITSFIIFYIGAFHSVNGPYKRGWNYLKESRNYIYAVIVLFFLFAIFGFLYADQLRFLDQILLELMMKTKNLNTVEMIDFIFFNNLQVSFLGLFFGVILGIFSFINVVSNGVVLGYVFSRLADASRLGEFWRIFPHGIFELPAIFISLALGVKLGMFIFMKAKGKELGRRFRESMVVFVFYVTPLLIVAAIIEGLLIAFL